MMRWRINFLANEKAHPPLGAGASVEHRVEVESTMSAAEQSGSLRLDAAPCSLLEYVVSVDPSSNSGIEGVSSHIIRGKAIK